MLRSTSLRSPSQSVFHGQPIKDRPLRTTSLNPSRGVFAMQSGELFPIPPSVQGQLGDKYAIIEVGGNQQIVEENRNYTCHRLNVPVGSVVKLPRVVAVKQDGDFAIGDPFLENVTVEAEILEDFRGPKIIVFKYRPKKHYRKIKGHRQEMTKFRVTKIQKE